MLSNNNSNNNNNNKQPSPFINVPADIILYLFNYLDTRSAFYLALCVVGERVKIEKIQGTITHHYDRFFAPIKKKNQIKLVSTEHINFYLSSLNGCYAWHVPAKNEIQPEFMDTLKDFKIKMIAGELDQIFFLTIDGKLISYVNNCGNLEKFPDLNNFTIMKSLQNKKIAAIAVGYGHALLLAEEKLFSFGRNHEGQLGLGTNADCREPQLIDVLANKKISSITAKHHQSFCIAHGEVYAWGQNDYGQLGMGNKIYQNKPQMIEALRDKKIVAIALGHQHTLCLAENGELYGFGRNYEGQLGLGHTEGMIEIPQLVKLLLNKKIVAIAAGDHHSLCLTNEGQVYSFGAGLNGQLGLKENANSQKEPQLIEELNGRKITSIAACGSASLFLTDDHKILTCGHILSGEFKTGMIEIPTFKTQDNQNESHGLKRKFAQLGSS